jgi:hypothetical protein
MDNVKLIEYIFSRKSRERRVLFAMVRENGDAKNWAVSAVQSFTVKGIEVPAWMLVFINASDPKVGKLLAIDALIKEANKD